MDESALKALISSLEASRGSLDFWLNASSLLVVIGVILEIVFVVREYGDDLRDWRRGFVHPPERPSRRWLVMELMGVALVSLGVAGEFFIDVKAGALETQIREANDRRASLLSGEAARLTKEAEDERLARVQVEASVAPRQITKDQRLGMSSRLSRFHGQSVTALHNVFDIEASVFAVDLLDMLRSAQWNTHLQISISGNTSVTLVQAPEMPETGILVQGGPDKRSRLAAQALAKELSRNGFNCRVVSKGIIGFAPDSIPVVAIEVEPRPIGAQGEVKLFEEAQAKQQSSKPSGKP